MPLYFKIVDVIYENEPFTQSDTRQT